MTLDRITVDPNVCTGKRAFADYSFPFLGCLFF